MRTKIGNQISFMVAEMRFLRAAYINSDKLNNFDESLLYHIECQSIFQAIKQLKEKNCSLTRASLLQEASDLNLNITEEVIERILDCENVESYSDDDIKNINEQLDKAKIGRNVLNSLQKLEEKIAENPTNIVSLKPEVEKALSDVNEKLLVERTTKRLETFKETLDAYSESLAERKLGKKYLFYDPILDEIIKAGPAPGSGGLISAASGMGKSAFCLKIINGLIDAEVPCLYYSLEMGRTDTIDRLISLRKGIPMSDIINPREQSDFDAIWDAFQEERKVLERKNLFRFSENAFVSLSQVEYDIAKFKQEENVNYCIVVFDLLSMIKDFTILQNGLNFAQGIEVAINVLNGLAKKLNFHYIAVLQMNRKLEEGQVSDLDDIEKFRPKRDAIKNSNAFLERCRWSIGLFRPRYYAEQYLEKSQYEELEDFCYVYMLKQNQGSVGKSGKYLFNPEIMRMTPVLDEDEKFTRDFEIED